MKIIPVVCQRCGAPLELADESVRFVTCAHCSTPLEIVREATQSHSRISEQIQAATQDHSRRLEIVELESELLQLDKQWETVRERLCGRSRSGALNDSPMAGCIWPGISISVGGLVFVIGLCSNPKDFLFPSAVFFTLALVSGIMLWLSANRAQKEFAPLQGKYLESRMKLVQKIDQAKG